MHNPTLFYIAILLNLFMSVLYMILGLIMKRHKWLFAMSAEALIYAIGLPLFLMQGNWTLWATALLPNILLHTGNALVWAAADSQLGIKRAKFWYALPPAALTAGYIPVLFFWDSFIGRTFISSVVVFGTYLTVSIFYFIKMPRRNNIVYILTGLNMALIGMAFLSRIVLILAAPLLPVLGDTQFQWTYVLMAIILSTLAVATSFVMMMMTQNEQELEKLSAMNADRDRLLSILSHDLRGTNGILEKMLGVFIENDAGQMRPESAGLMKKIHAAAKDQGEMLKNLLIWMKAQKDGIQPDLQAMDIGGVLNATAGLFAEMANAKGIRLENRAGQRLMASADTEMLKTVVRNLLSNAVKFTDFGGRVEISSGTEIASGTKGGEAVITISDNGTGFEPGDPDAPGSVPGTQGETGTGLGLRICADFTEKMGGRLEIKSVPGKGTTVRIRLKAV